MEHKIERWETLHSEYLFKRPWLTVRRDKVQLPNGTIHDEYYVLEYPTWVNVIAITEDGEFVMVEQYRHGLEQVFTELVAGVAEPGEKPLDAAKRELAEETGYTGGKWVLNTVLSANPGSTNNLTYSFIATGVSKTENTRLDSTEDLRTRLLTEAEVLEILKNDELKQSLMAAPLWKYFATKQK